MHTKQWTVQIYLTEEDDDRTCAQAVLKTRSDTDVRGVGTARRNPADHPVPEIGDELAAARALSDLSHRLLDAAAKDIEQVAVAR